MARKSLGVIAAIIGSGLALIAPAMAVASSAPTPHHVKIVHRPSKPKEITIFCDGINVNGTWDPTMEYCDFSSGDPGGRGCLNADASVANWESCRNQDIGFWNATPYSVRLYYSPNYAGAWICVPGNTDIGSLSGKDFNNGSGDPGYGDPVRNDVASSTLSGSNNCSNGTT
jgi:Peptidase inhibitor family I36